MRLQYIAYREIKAALFEKSFALILLLEFLLIISSGLLSAGYTLITSPESSPQARELSSLVFVGLISDTPDEFATAFSGTRTRYRIYDSYSLAKADLSDGVLDAIIMGDISLSETPDVIQVYLPANTPKEPLIRLAMRSIFTNLESEVRNRKVSIHHPSINLPDIMVMGRQQSGRRNEIYYVFTLPLLLFLPSLIAGSLTIDSLTQDMESKRMINLILAPIHDLEIIFGKAASSFVISMSQSILWLFMVDLFFVPLQNIPLLLFISGVYTVVFMNLGAIMSLHLKKMKSSQMTYTFFSMSAITLFSPVANIHPILREMSPAYLITKLALGFPAAEFTPHILGLLSLTLLTLAYIVKIRAKVKETQ
jgi:ABC-2 type transport system permease protein